MSVAKTVEVEVKLRPGLLKNMRALADERGLTLNELIAEVFTGIFECQGMPKRKEGE